MSNNEYIKKAEAELEYLTGDEETKRLAFLREKAIRDEMAAMAKARREGRAEGHAEGLIAGEKYNIPIDVDTIEKGYPILCA